MKHAHSISYGKEYIGIYFIQILLYHLKSRYRQFKQAAIDAKKSGNKQDALKFLRAMKGMEPMIQNAMKGLPIGKVNKDI